MSKGSKRRPAAVPPATVDANYERTFGAPLLPRRTVELPPLYAPGQTLESLASRYQISRTPSGRSDADA